MTSAQIEPNATEKWEGSCLLDLYYLNMYACCMRVCVRLFGIWERDGYMEGEGKVVIKNNRKGLLGIRRRCE